MSRNPNTRRAAIDAMKKGNKPTAKKKKKLSKWDLKPKLSEA